MTPTQGLEPTQVQQPWRAVLRTALQVGVPAFLALPFIIEIIIDELGDKMPPGLTGWLYAAAAVITAAAAALARIMAIPQVEVLLRRLPAAAFAAQARPKPNDAGAARALDVAFLVAAGAAAALLLAAVMLAATGGTR